MSYWHRSILGLTFVAPIACSNGRTQKSSAPPSTSSPELVTQHSRYRADVDSMLVRVTVAFRYTNTGPDTTFIPKCLHPVRPILEKWIDARWEMVYQPIEPRCFEPPVVVAPGACFSYSPEIVGGRVGRNLFPEFSGEVPGYYRLVWGVHPGRGHEEQAVSNVFEIVE